MKKIHCFKISIWIWYSCKQHHVVGLGCFFVCFEPNRKEDAEEAVDGWSQLSGPCWSGQHSQMLALLQLCPLTRWVNGRPHARRRCSWGPVLSACPKISALGPKHLDSTEFQENNEWARNVTITTAADWHSLERATPQTAWWHGRCSLLSLLLLFFTILQKNWCFWTVVFEETLESPLDCKEIQPVHPKGDQSWMFIVRTDAEAETPIPWPPDVKNWLIGKDPDAGKEWRQEEKGFDRQWDCWMASPMRWTWVWANSGIWWWTGKP